MALRAVRAAVYCRVSTDDQADRGTSLLDQQERCDAYCQSESWTAVGPFIDDGISGATTDRPELSRLMKDAAQGAFDRVVVTDPDRLSRDLVDGLIIERDLAKHGVEVIYLVQPSMGTLERQIRGVIAEEERRKIRERTSRGLRAIAQAGHWPGGAAPYGYLIVREPQGHSSLAVNESEAATIRRMIHALVDRRLTTWELATELNADQTPTPSSGRKVSNPGGPRWNHRRVRDILSTARGIAGTWTYNTSSGTYVLDIPPIVTEERLQQLRDRLAESSTGRGATNRKHTFLLARRVSSQCGNPMHSYARSDGSGRVYRCSMSTADRGPDRCDCRRVSADAVETAVWDLVAAELADPDRLQRLAGLAATQSERDEDDKDDLQTLDRKIQRLEKAIGSEIAELLASGVNSDTVRIATQELESRLDALQHQRSQVLRWTTARAEAATQIDRITRLAISAREAITNPTPDLKARIIEVLDIRVAIVNHTVCGTCDGKGLIPNAPEHAEYRRDHTGAICPTCKRHRTIPSIEVRGLLPNTDHLPQHSDSEGTPFTLHAVA